MRGTVLDAVSGLDDDVATLAHDGLDAFFACVESDPRLARVVWFEVVGVSARVEAAYIAQMKAFGELLVVLVDQKGVGPRMRAQERSVVLLAVVGGVSQVVLNWVNQGFKPPRPRLVRPGRFPARRHRDARRRRRPRGSAPDHSSDVMSENITFIPNVIDPERSITDT